MFVAALFLSVCAVSHPASVSRTIAHVEPGRALVNLRFQTASLLEALPRLDGNGDGRFTEDELGAGSKAVGDYLLANWRLLQPDFEQEDALPGSLLSLEFAQDLEGLDETFQWIDAELEFLGEGSLGELVVHSELFTERDPYHRDFMTFSFGDESPWEVLFSAGEHRWHFRAAALRAGGVRAEFFKAALSSGTWRVGLALFILTLVVAAAGPRKLLGGLALFLVGLLFGALLVAWDQAPPERFVFLALPLALAYIGAENLLRRTARMPFVEAPLFGVLLAVSVASAHADDWAFEPLQFQVGLGLGGAIIAVGLGATFLAFAIAKLVPGPRTRDAQEGEGLAAHWLYLCVSAAASSIGLVAFALRTEWIG